MAVVATSAAINAVKPVTWLLVAVDFDITKVHLICSVADLLGSLLEGIFAFVAYYV